MSLSKESTLEAITLAANALLVIVNDSQLKELDPPLYFRVKDAIQILRFPTDLSRIRDKNNK